MPAAAAAFASAHPAVDLCFTEAEPPEAVRLLRSGEVEVALLFGHPGTPSPDLDGLRHETLIEEPTFLVAPPGWPGDELADHRARPWTGGCERCRGHLLRSCAAAGFTPDIRYTTDDYVAVQRLVAAGLAVATLPALALSAHRDDRVRIVPLPGPGRSILAAVHGDPPDPPGTAALLAHLRAAAEALPPAPDPPDSAETPNPSRTAP